MSGASQLWARSLIVPVFDIELLYVQVSERANIELSMMVEGLDGSSFCDVEVPVDTPYDPGLPAEGFKILGSDRMLLSVDGQWSAGKEQCSSCERRGLGVRSGGGCLPATRGGERRSRVFGRGDPGEAAGGLGGGADDERYGHRPPEPPEVEGIQVPIGGSVGYPPRL